MRASWQVLALALVAGSALAAPGSAWFDAAAGSREAGARAGALDEQTQKLRDELEDVHRDERATRAFSVARGRAYVRLARAGLMPLSDGFEALAAHASRLERLRRALARDLAHERKLVSRRLEIARAIQDLENMQPAERDSMARARTAIVAAEERDEAFQRAFQSDWSPPGRTAVYGAQPSPAHVAAERPGGFAAQRGHLPFPLAGRAELDQVPSPSGSGKALLMASTFDAPVRAVYAGRVAFADDYPELGYTVIVDHGDHYYTLSAHLARITVEVGEELESGQRIGTVGTHDQKPALLFEVRAGQSTLNTAEWFGI
jgi:septal ring factor EnvC (AmiA/AmiB activator)